MYHSESNDNFVLDKFIELFDQKNIKFSSDKEKNYFASIFLQISNKDLLIKTEKIFIKYALPVSFEKIFYELLQALSDIKYELNQLEYNPINQKVTFKNKTIKLKSFHNIIFKNLFLNKDTGIQKELIYLNLWPNDKDIMINKLDTHLTNLKNFLKEELDFNLQFVSSAGMIKLVG